MTNPDTEAQVTPSSFPSDSGHDDQQFPGSSQTSTATTPPPPDLTPEQLKQREKKINTVRSSINNLESEIAQVESRLEETRSKLKHDQTTTVRNHIRLLHEYNEIKDIGQGLMGFIADARGLRQIEVQKDFGVGPED